MLLTKHAIQQLLIWNGQVADLPTPAEWTCLRQLVCLLKPFQQVTDYLQGQNYPTLSAASRLVHSIISGLEQAVPPPNWNFGKWIEIRSSLFSPALLILIFHFFIVLDDE